MSNNIANLLLRNLNDVFAENDPVRRRAAIDEIFHEDAVFYDPSGGVFHGRDEIDHIAGVIKATHPDFKYQPLSPPEERGDAGRVQWVSGTPGKPPAYAGTDFIVARNGRIASVYLFFDKLPQLDGRVTSMRGWSTWKRPGKKGRMGINDQEKIEIAREYFMRADQGRPDILELFHEDAEVYFPKFGFGFGRNSFLEMVKGFAVTLESIQHDYDGLTFIPSGDYLVVEGTSEGRMSGKPWAGGKTPGGRFCNVFKFRDDRISSVHIYLDPDYTGEDEVRFRWGKNRQW